MDDLEKGMNLETGNHVILQITSNIQQLNQNVQNLNVYVEKIGGPEDTEAGKSTMVELIQNSNVLSKKISQLMKELVSLSNDNRQFRVQRERLTNDYMSVLNRLQSTQRKAVTKEKNKIKTVTIEDEMLSSRTEDEQQRRQMQVQHRINLQEIKGRQEALSQLETDIDDINMIFKDLARIVHDQGEMVDSIEANIEHASIQVEDGRVNVERAVIYQKKARQKKLLLLIFFTVLILIFILVAYLWKS